jgi:hypothetical protein
VQTVGRGKGIVKGVKEFGVILVFCQMKMMGFLSEFLSMMEDRRFFRTFSMMDSSLALEMAITL